MMAPFGKYTKPSRFGAAGAAVAAGTMASRKGRATAAEIPFSSVRRERDLLVMNIYTGFFLIWNGSL
jgi:hypothetical protein